MTDWRLIPFSALFRRVPRRDGHPCEELLSVYRDFGVIRKSDRNDNYNRPGALEDYQLVRPGDLVFNKMKAWQGSLGVSSIRGIVSPAYFVYEPLLDNNSKFMHYALRSQDSIHYYAAHSTGIRVNQWDLSPEWLDMMKLPVPGYDAQRRIADYLDEEVREMDALIADLLGLVEGLETRKKEFVRREFKKEARWNLGGQRLKFLVEVQDGRRRPIDSGDRKGLQGNYPYYGASGVIDKIDDFIWDNEKRLLLSEDGANLALRNHPIAFVADGRYWVNNHAHVLRVLGGVPEELVADAIEISPIHHLITGSAQPKLTSFAMGEIAFPFPRDLESAIAMHKCIAQEQAKMDFLIKEATKLIENLKARKAALITEVVTGRKKV